MTQKERRAYMLKWHKFQQKYEIAFTDRFTNALQIQVKTYIKNQDITGIPSFPIYDVLVKLYKSIGIAWAKEIKMSFTKADGQMGFSERMLELIRQYYSIDLLNDAELMTRYSREVIMQVLSRAAESGAQFSDIAYELMNHPEFNRSRALRIARTETVTAANGAANLYARESGLQLDKTWIAIRDNRTRHTHMDIDPTPIPMDQPFLVGGSQMMQPGARMQPNGLPVPAKEIVNCRCTVGYIPKRDADGRLIRR